MKNYYRLPFTKAYNVIDFLLRVYSRYDCLPDCLLASDRKKEEILTR